MSAPPHSRNSLLGLTQETKESKTSYYAKTPNGLLIDQRTPSGNYNPLYDAQGDIIALVNTSGKAERTFHYGPYGENTTSEGTQTVPYPFGYKAGYHTPGGNKGETNIPNGLYHYGQRYYDPTTGRWTQQDPLEQDGSPVEDDRYTFAGDDSVNDSDPRGLTESADELGEHDLKDCAAGGARSRVPTVPSQDRRGPASRKRADVRTEGLSRRFVTVTKN